MQLDQETIENQQALLAAHRRRLRYRLHQLARLGDYAPPDVALDIDETHATILDLKAALQASGVVVADLPEDTAQVLTTLTLLSPMERRNRDAMIQKVRSFWVTGLLDHSLAAELRIALDLEERPDTVLLPLNVQVQELRRPRRILPSGTPIIEVFDALGGELLILGAPGAGKTTLLLELTRDLLERATQDEIHPIPVVFNLSSWVTKRLSIAAWLVEELNTVYDVPRKVAQVWVDHDALLLLFDGLDEVRVEHRAACVEAINAYRKDHGMVDLVVCSRVGDYEVLGVRLKLQGAVLIQPLTEQQITTYLDQAGDRLAGLQSVLAVDATLRELAESPLMLGIIVLAYQGRSVTDLPTTGSADALRQHLFNTYIERMFMRRSVEVQYPQEQTLRSLAWLARGMEQQTQSVFLIEGLQPNWLPAAGAQRYYALIDRLGFGCSVGVGIGLVAGLVTGLISGASSGFVFGLTIGVDSALITGGFGGACYAHPSSHYHTWRSILSTIVLTLGIMLISVVGLGLVLGEHGIYVGMLVGGLVSGVGVGLLGRPDIRPRCITVVETLRWSALRALLSAQYGLYGGLVTGLIWDVAEDLRSGEGLDIRWGLTLGLLFGMIFGSITGLVGGFVSGQVEATTVPNQGIRRSARSATVVGLVSGLVGLVSMLILGLLFPFSANDLLFGGLTFALLTGLVGALAYGGQACLSHLALRTVLWYHSGVMPPNVARFLDNCAERIFLRKIGGGYIFVHRLLLEYLAALEVAPPVRVSDVG